MNSGLRATHHASGCMGHRRRKSARRQADDCRVACHQAVHVWTTSEGCMCASTKVARSPGWCDEVPLLQGQGASDGGVIAASDASVSATAVCPVRSGVKDVVDVRIPWIASCRVSPDESIVLQI